MAGPNSYYTRMVADRHTAGIARGIRNNAPVGSYAREISNLKWLCNTLKYMEEACPEYRQKLCDRHGLSMPELRELIPLQEARVKVSLRGSGFEEKHRLILEKEKHFEAKTKP